MKFHYYYLHENGDLIGKVPEVVETDPSYFDSSFVKKVWKINVDNRLDAWNLCLEALSLGAKVERIKELAEKWGLTPKDAYAYMDRTPPSREGANKLFIFMRDVHKYSLEEIATWIGGYHGKQCTTNKA